MKKFQFLTLIILFSSAIKAQNSDEKKILLTSNANTFGVSTINLLDPYLSPLTYSGFGISYEHENRRFLSTEKTNISTQGKLNMEASYNLNPQSTSSMMFLGVNYSWGMHYHFRPAKGLQLLAGGLWDADFGFKEVPRNINNPVSLDLATNLNLSGVAMFDVRLRKKTFRLQLELQTPILGYMFVPLNGASYYEMFDLGNMTDAFHVSSLHNKRGVKSSFTIDVPSNQSVWRFGLNFMNVKYSANDLVFVRNELSLVVGTTFDTANFAGRKNKVPKNFISTNE